MLIRSRDLHRSSIVYRPKLGSLTGGLQRGCAKAQVWIAESGYEWWQILIGLAVLVLVVVSWLQASRRHSGPSSGRSSRAPRTPASSWFFRQNGLR